MCKTDVHFFKDVVDSGFQDFVQSSAIFLYTYLIDPQDKAATNNGLLININYQLFSPGYQIGIFRMPFKECLCKRTIDFYGQVVGAGISEGVFRQC